MTIIEADPDSKVDETSTHEPTGMSMAGGTEASLLATGEKVIMQTAKVRVVNPQNHLINLLV